MEATTGWTDGSQKFHFAGCGGTLMNDIKRQMGKTGNSQLVIGTLGGNNGFFGDIARACIYQPDPGPWGPTYDEDPNGEGQCKKNLAKSRAYIQQAQGGLRDQFKSTLDDIFAFKQTNGQLVPRFDIYVSSYVQFFDATTDPCDEWSFGRWFSVAYPKLVKPLRAEMNELVQMFNDVQADVIKNYPKNLAYDYNVHYIPISDEFQGHRFCEANHSENDQWTSSDVWIWNLQWNDGDTGGKTQPPGAPNGPLPVMSLDTQNRTSLDNQLFTGSDVKALQSGFGWTARPFHPKPLGYQHMSDYFIQKFKDDKIPGIAGANAASPTTKGLPAKTTPTSPPTKAPSYATGSCCFHVDEYQNCNPMTNNLYANITLVDNNKKIIYQTPQQSLANGRLGDPINDGDHMTIQGPLPYPIAVTGEHENDYIQFSYGSLSWTSRDSRCSNGGWNPRDGPVCHGGRGFQPQPAENQIDCCFPC